MVCGGAFPYLLIGLAIVGKLAGENESKFGEDPRYNEISSLKETGHHLSKERSGEGLKDYIERLIKLEHREEELAKKTEKHLTSGGVEKRTDHKSALSSSEEHSSSSESDSGSDEHDRKRHYLSVALDHKHHQQVAYPSLTGLKRDFASDAHNSDKGHEPESVPHEKVIHHHGKYHPEHNVLQGLLGNLKNEIHKFHGTKESTPELVKTNVHEESQPHELLHKRRPWSYMLGKASKRKFAPHHLRDLDSMAQDEGLPGASTSSVSHNHRNRRNAEVLDHHQNPVANNGYYVRRRSSWYELPEDATEDGDKRVKLGHPLTEEEMNSMIRNMPEDGLAEDKRNHKLMQPKFDAENKGFGINHLPNHFEESHEKRNEHHVFEPLSEEEEAKRNELSDHLSTYYEGNGEKRTDHGEFPTLSLEDFKNMATNGNSVQVPYNMHSSDVDNLGHEINEKRNHELHKSSLQEEDTKRNHQYGGVPYEKRDHEILNELEAEEKRHHDALLSSEEKRNQGSSDHTHLSEEKRHQGSSDHTRLNEETRHQGSSEHTHLNEEKRHQGSSEHTHLSEEKRHQGSSDHTDLNEEKRHQGSSEHTHVNVVEAKRTQLERDSEEKRSHHLEVEEKRNKGHKRSHEHEEKHEFESIKNEEPKRSHLSEEQRHMKHSDEKRVPHETDNSLEVEKRNQNQEVQHRFNEGGDKNRLEQEPYDENPKRNQMEEYPNHLEEAYKRHQLNKEHYNAMEAKRNHLGRLGPNFASEEEKRIWRYEVPEYGSNEQKRHEFQPIHAPLHQFEEKRAHEIGPANRAAESMQNIPENMRRLYEARKRNNKFYMPPRMTENEKRTPQYEMPNYDYLEEPKRSQEQGYEFPGKNRNHFAGVVDKRFQNHEELENYEEKRDPMFNYGGYYPETDEETKRDPVESRQRMLQENERALEDLKREGMGYDEKREYEERRAGQLPWEEELGSNESKDKKSLWNYLPDNFRQQH